MRHHKFLALIPALLLAAAPALSHAAIGIGVSVNIEPPVLPVYVQPPLPAPGYLWTPGYWAWDGSDYYWVPGTWVQPPQSGLLWTPGYWGWTNGAYLWNGGYWGPQVGFYGGVNYGFGYTGSGYHGGYWHGGAFFYNRAVANFGGVHIMNVYSAPVPHTAVSRVSFNGGQGGIHAQPSAGERAAMTAHHFAATSMQIQHEQHAAGMPAMHMHQNGGRPQILTTQRAGDFAHPGPGLSNHHAGGPGPAMHGPAHPQGGAPEQHYEDRPAPQALHGGPSPERGPPPQRGGEAHGQQHQQGHAEPERHNDR
jgi:WXXGXW repeat (2 copies)